MSTRDGNPEIYVDESRRIERAAHHATIPASTRRRRGRRPATQIAFTSDRTGSPQIYIVGADGLDQPRRITSDES